VVIIRYRAIGTMPEGPYGSIDEVYVGEDASAIIEYDGTEEIACGKPVRMPEVFYKLVLEETLNGSVVRREVVGPKPIRVYTPGLVVYFY